MIGLYTQEPYASMLLDGEKTVETRDYDLPTNLRGEKIWLLACKEELKRSADTGILEVQSIGWIRVNETFPYQTEEQWNCDASKHRVPFQDPTFRWKGQSKFGWKVSFSKWESLQNTLARVTRIHRSLVQIEPIVDKPRL